MPPHLPTTNGRSSALASGIADDARKSLKRGHSTDTADETTSESIDFLERPRKIARHSSSDPAETRSNSTSSESGEDDELSDDDSESEDDESEDFSSSSEESPDSGSERETLIPQSRRPKKPDFRTSSSPSNLRQRLRTFLPEMEKANQELEDMTGDGRTMAGLEIETTTGDDDDEDEEDQEIRFSDSNDVEEKEPYIEMNLGLGVLEQKGDSISASTSPSSESTSDTDADVMGKLLGRKRRKSHTGIQEL